MLYFWFICVLLVDFPGLTSCFVQLVVFLPNTLRGMGRKCLKG